MKGIDVSHHNNLTSKLVTENDFVIMKATEGKDFKDSALDKSYDLIHGKSDGKPDGNVLYGFYHFANSYKNSYKYEAEWFLKHVKHHAGYCVYALDWEGSNLKVKPEWAFNWLKYVFDETGVRPLIYLQSSELMSTKYELILYKFPLWVAHWKIKKPKTYGYDYALWQYGVENNIDRNLLNGDESYWRELCGNARFVFDKKIKKGSVVKVKNLVDYNGVINDKWVLNERFVVSSIKNDRVVICFNGKLTGVWNIKDLEVIS